MLLFGVRWTLVGSDWSDNELINFILLSVLTAVITAVLHILPRYFTTSFLWSKYHFIIAENSFKYSEFISDKTHSVLTISQSRAPQAVAVLNHWSPFPAPKVVGDVLVFCPRLLWTVSRLSGWKQGIWKFRTARTSTSCEDLSQRRYVREDLGLLWVRYGIWHKFQWF